MVQAFLSMSTETLTEEELIEFSKASPYDASNAVQVIVNGNRRLMRAITTPEAVNATVAYFISINRDPHLLRVLNKDGTNYGESINIIIDENGNETQTIVGTPIYPPNLEEYQSFFTPYVIQDIEGNDVTVTPSENTGAGWVL